MVHKFCRAVQRESRSGSLDVSRVRLQLAQAIDLVVDPLEGRSENLLAL